MSPIVIISLKFYQQNGFIVIVILKNTTKKSRQMNLVIFGWFEGYKGVIISLWDCYPKRFEQTDGETSELKKIRHKKKSTEKELKKKKLDRKKKYMKKMKKKKVNAFFFTNEEILNF